jgi:hypothetical protein
MLRAGDGADAPLTFLHIFPGGEVTLAIRKTPRGSIDQKELGSVRLPAKLRIERKGGSLMLSVAEGAGSWRKVASVPVSGMPDSVQAGFAVLSHDPYHLAAVPIRNLQLNPAKL